MNAQYIKLIIILIIAGSSVIRWIFVKLQEQAAKKRAQEALERQQVEAIRTGTNLEAPDPEVERARAQAEMAAKRQAQIEEFRRRQQERARQRAQQGPVAAPTASSPRPTPPTARPAQPRPAPQRGPRQLLTPTPAPISEEQPTHRLVPTAPEPRQAAGAARASLAPPRSAEQWRRIIVMNTLLSPPPGLGGSGDPWAPVA